jgi:O-succinylbenzoic acid--CoA ligase
MTETVSHIALRKLNGVEKSDIFRVLPQIQISQDARGCLQIQGEVTNNKLLITNDLVEILEENKFRWLGRADNVANSGGVKIHLEQVEQMIDKVLTDNGFEGDFFVGVLPDEKLGQKLILLIESITQTADWEKTVRTQFKKELPLYHSPSQIFYLPHFARTETGKIHRANTQALLDSGITKL